MKAYELLYIVPSSTDKRTRAGVQARIKSVVSESGKIDKVDEWGKRKLAYEIDAQNEADYTLIDFHADPANVAELDRVLRINDAVMRHMITRRTDRY
jgi:small subunit ribosomal protein S6